MDLRSSEYDVVSLYVLCCYVNGSVCFVCCVFDSVCELMMKQFAMCLVVVTILLLNVIEVFSVCEGALLDRRCMVFQRMCVFACDPSKLLGAPSICFVCVFVCRKLSPHLGVGELDHRCLLSLCCFFV